MRHTALYIAALSLAGSGLTGCNSPSHWATASEAIAVPATELIAVRCKSHNGDIQVDGIADLTEVRVLAHKRAGGDSDADAAAALAALIVTHDVSEGQLSIGYEWSEDPASNWAGSVEFELEAPAGLNFALHSHNGDITARTIAGELRAISHNGSISGNGSMEVVQLDSHNGSVSLRVRESPRLGGSIESHNGQITLGLDAEGTTSRLDFQSRNGSITSTVRLSDAARGDNSLHATLGDAEAAVIPELRIRSHNGSIRLDRAR